MAGACSHLQIPVFFTFVNMYGNILSNEEIFHAYIGGMKDLIRFASGIFM